MAETQPKRLREESHHEENSKRQKPYNNIFSFLDEDEVEEQLELSQDLSAIFTTLQRELSTDSSSTFEFDSLPSTTEESAAPDHGTTGSPNYTSDLDDGLRSVMTHLLEASDDELGIPNIEGPDGNFNNTADARSDEINPFAFNDHGLWELEDEAANYYTVLQSELFM
ncbi:hypothetical protein ACJIZ3_025189 [Penstemon smallii]|uniref:Uncharacterized protein n=1 Tax=Penstemon smallii TaxID=265156 RepID=A0ABD3TWH6_9LAMI